MAKTKIALFAIPILAAVLVGASFTPAFAEMEGPLVIEVQIDIKPASDPNSINTKSMGLVAVAILGSDTFDVLDVDVSTLTFGSAGASPAHSGHLEDVNGDGLTDLVTHYVQKQTGLAVGDTQACISGTTTDGTPISGCDSVNIVM